MDLNFEMLDVSDLPAKGRRGRQASPQIQALREGFARIPKKGQGFRVPLSQVVGNDEVKTLKDLPADKRGKIAGALKTGIRNGWLSDYDEDGKRRSLIESKAVDVRIGHGKGEDEDFVYVIRLGDLPEGVTVGTDDEDEAEAA